VLYGSDALGGAVNLIPYRFHIGAGENVEFNGAVVSAYQSNNKEGEPRDVLPESPDVDLVLDVYTGRLEVENVNVFNLSGTLGAETKYYDHENIGKVALQPTGHFTNLALFDFEEWHSEKITLNFGARFDYRAQKFICASINPLLPADDERTFSSLSGAFGASYKLSHILTATSNIGCEFRTPSFYNLYVYGYHGGVFAFQIGNPELENETLLDINSSLRLRSKRIEATATVFQNRVNNYILVNFPAVLIKIMNYR